MRDQVNDLRRRLIATLDINVRDSLAMRMRLSLSQRQSRAEVTSELAPIDAPRTPEHSPAEPRALHAVRDRELTEPLASIPLRRIR
jgi:hypothetical protein